MIVWKAKGKNNKIVRLTFNCLHWRLLLLWMVLFNCQMADHNQSHFKAENGKLHLILLQLLHTNCTQFEPNCFLSFYIKIVKAKRSIPQQNFMSNHTGLTLSASGAKIILCQNQTQKFRSHLKLFWSEENMHQQHVHMKSF